MNDLLEKIIKDYNLEGQQLQASVNKDGNKVVIELEPVNFSAREADAFREYLKLLPDEIFVQTCESLGQDEIARISNCLNSENIDSVRAGILKFKAYLKCVLECKIQELKEILASC